MMPSARQHCAPNVSTFRTDDHFSCFEMEELVSVAKSLNKSISRHKLCSKNACVAARPFDIEGLTKKQLWGKIYKTLSPFCKYERCWVDLDFVNAIPSKSLREKIKYFTFKPKMSPDRYAWLSTRDIDYVLNQYQRLAEQRAPGKFLYLGAHPADYAVVENPNYKAIRHHPLVGIVFNLDTHDMKGSHWVAMVVDNTLGRIEYFDSTGKGPNKHIARFIKTIQKRTHYPLVKNSFVHQKKNGECGVYAIHFVIQRLLGRSFEQVSSKIISDKAMNKVRDLIFSPSMDVSISRAKNMG